MTERQLAPLSHPDWFLSLSGGVDSVAAFLLTHDTLRENYQKRPVALHFDTGVGLPLNRLYLEELCDRYGEQLWTLRTHENFESWVENDDAPGPGAHRNVRNELKGRQASKINTLADQPVHILGLRANESDTRAQMAKVEQRRRHVEVRPVHRLSKVECAEVILRHENCPINPCWLWNHATDCWCLAHGDPSELDVLERRFPWFAQRLREIEEAADADGLRGTLGWGGLSATEQQAIEQGQEQMTLCGESCNRRTEPPLAEAFRARLNGATPEDAIEVLHEVAATEEVRVRA